MHAVELAATHKCAPEHRATPLPSLGQLTKSFCQLAGVRQALNGQVLAKTVLGSDGGPENWEFRLSSHSAEYSSSFDFSGQG